MDKWLRNLGLLLVLAVLVSPVACAGGTVAYITVSPGNQVDDYTEAQLLKTQMADVTVLVQAENGLGSAVMFTSTLALTAAHVVAKDHPMDGSQAPALEMVGILKSMDGRPWLVQAKVIKYDPELDLAVLKLEREYPYGKAKFAPHGPYLYQKCWISGHPHGVTDTTITEGRVQALWDEGFIRYSAQSTFGNSGGPVWVRDGDRFFVFSICQRVHVEGFSATTHLGLGVLPDKMLDFVREYH